MVMWFRLAGALAVTLAALGALDYWGAVVGGRSIEHAQETTHRVREIFWHLIFVLVMATAVLAAVRRWTDHLRRRF